MFDRGAEDERCAITADSDFGMLLAMRRATIPSVVHLRDVAERGPDEHLALLVANLPQIAADLEAGAIASLSPARLSVRDLPIR